MSFAPVTTIDTRVRDLEVGNVQSLELTGLRLKEDVVLSPVLVEAVELDFPPTKKRPMNLRGLYICLVAMFTGLIACLGSLALSTLIQLVTNISFYGHFSIEKKPPSENHLGAFVIFIPVVGALCVGLMARYGSKAIRGHGIPEAMEQVLVNNSKIPPRVTILKPLSAAIAIGTGGPFGAEGPIVATGAGFGSNIGQILTVTNDERKTLLAAGAAAGMTATFGTPLASILLAVELLLFEYRLQSLLPVALACLVAASGRLLAEGFKPVLTMAEGPHATVPALIAYLLIGAIIGGLSVLVIRSIYFVEDCFERLPVHWMWWPPMAGVLVGVLGFVEPRILGVGYDSIDALLLGELGVGETFKLGGLKFVAWAVALGSGTSGGTLSPLLIIGGCPGSLLAKLAALIAPFAHVDSRLGAIVGMAGLFAGCTRAPMSSALFMFEATHEPRTVVPLISGVMAAVVVSSFFKRNSIMTEKIARRGVLIPSGCASDNLEVTTVADVCAKKPVVLKETDNVEEVKKWLNCGAWGSEHHGFPVLDEEGHLRGLVTRKDLLSVGDGTRRTVKQLIRRPPVICYDQCTVREAMTHMLRHRVGRLVVVKKSDHTALVGVIGRGDVLRTVARNLIVPPVVAAASPVDASRHDSSVPHAENARLLASQDEDDLPLLPEQRKRTDSLLAYISSHCEQNHQASRVLEVAAQFYRVHDIPNQGYRSRQLLVDTVAHLLQQTLQQQVAGGEASADDRPRVVVKFGSHTGCGTVAVAAALSPHRGDLLVAVEQSEQSVATTESLLKLCGLTSRVIVVKCLASDVATWREKLGRLKVDILILSHNKACYCEDLEAVEAASGGLLLNKGCAVIADDVLGIGYPLGAYMKHVHGSAAYASSEQLEEKEDERSTTATRVSLEVSIRTK